MWPSLEVCSPAIQRLLQKLVHGSPSSGPWLWGKRAYSQKREHYSALGLHVTLPPRARGFTL